MKHNKIVEAFDFIIDKCRMLLRNEFGQGDFGIATVLGNWSEHYRSWKNLKIAPI